MSPPRPQLMVMARAPWSGRTKTRLAAACGPRRAAAVASTLIRLVARRVDESWPGDWSLRVWPDGEHPLFRELAAHYRVSVVTQPAGGLGNKMQGCLRQGIGCGGAAAVLGTDVPDLSGDILRRLYRALRAGRSAIGPAADGGYYCIGFAGSVPDLFGAIGWGRAGVYRQTLARAARCGFVFDETLAVLRDVDDWNDLEWAARHIPELNCHVQPGRA